MDKRSRADGSSLASDPPDLPQVRETVTRIKGSVLWCAWMAMVLAAGCSRAQPPSAVVQEGPLRAIGPSGPTALPLSFTWRGASAESVVRVRIFDEAERAIYGIEARGNHVAAPGDFQRQLKAGTPYLWRVARVDENGQEVDQSELTSFSVQ